MKSAGCPRIGVIRGLERGAESPRESERGWSPASNDIEIGFTRASARRERPPVRRAAKNDVFIGDPLADRLTLYYELLGRWNRKINLTSLENSTKPIDRLLLEPLVASRYFSPSANRLMDVGSGGGSPAIPFKLAVPRLRLTMVEAKARKSAFLREAVRHLSSDGCPSRDGALRRASGQAGASRGSRYRLAACGPDGGTRAHDAAGVSCAWGSH